MTCPRCQKGTVKPGYQVCGWCMDEVIAGDKTKLKGRGYDLTNTQAIAGSFRGSRG